MLIVPAFVTSFMVTMRTGDDVGRFEASASCSQIGEKKDRRPAFFTGGDDIPLPGLRWKHFGATFYRVVPNNFARETLTRSSGLHNEQLSSRTKNFMTRVCTLSHRFSV